IRILIAIAAYYDYEIWQMNFKTAFLNGLLDEDIYMEQPEGLKEVKDYLGKCFSMKYLGEAAYILRIKIYRDRSMRLIGLSQSAYIDKILKKYNMHNSKKGYLPMEVKHDFSNELCASTPEEVAFMKKVPYASAVGSIMYAVRCTRPDVAFAQNLVSRYQQNLRKLHWVDVKHILKYLRNTRDMFFVYGGKPDTELVATSMVTETLVNIDSSTKKSSSISNKRVAAGFYIRGLEAVDKAMGQLARLLWEADHKRPLYFSVTPPEGAWTEYVSGGVTLLRISSTKHKERPLRAIDDAGHDKEIVFKVKGLEAVDKAMGQLARLLWEADHKRPLYFIGGESAILQTSLDTFALAVIKAGADLSADMVAKHDKKISPGHHSPTSTRKHVRPEGVCQQLVNQAQVTLDRRSIFDTIALLSTWTGEFNPNRSIHSIRAPSTGPPVKRLTVHDKGTSWQLVSPGHHSPTATRKHV
nr:retrotransposon protein, putative, Ty1-copia subclass [Tanacetum cinerariifolium]